MKSTDHISLITLKDLEVGYRRLGTANSVFGPVTADIVPGEMISVIGRNGIGKSTLLRTLAGLQLPLKGLVVYSGVPAEKIGLKEMARLVSYVSTEPVHSFQLRVHEIIALGRFPYTGWMGRLNAEDHEAINRAVDYTGVSALLNRPVSEVSDGERQKIMIARALAQDTPVIILDEPTAFLDLPSRYEILRLLNDLSLKGKAIVFSTHDLNIAMEIADRIWLMSDNDLHEGSPEDLLINDDFRKLFKSSPARFDPASMQFTFFRELSKAVKITGDDHFMAITQRAMKRIGFLTDDRAGLEIEIIVQSELPSWLLKSAPSPVKFSSIYDLTSYLKKKILN